MSQILCKRLKILKKVKHINNAFKDFKYFYVITFIQDCFTMA